ncbi:MAG: hypothetical protein E7599_03340 [Ruminococcaceae bacterium]|nr:hypothetical protein [Oscillospiraceae bacterium]
MEKSKEELEYLNGILNRTHDLIVRCDQKISVVLALLGTFLALFLNSDNLKTYKCIIQKLDSCVSGYEIIYFLFFSFSVVLCLIALVVLVCALMARIKGNLKNLEFFACIKKLDTDEFKKRFKHHCDKRKFDSLIDSIYANYKIARKKYHLFNVGLGISIGGIILLISTYICGLAL